MGEAKTKKRRHSKVLDRANGCVYCAGRGVAEQVDHMPPRAIFRMTQRPRGLEFPSCAACNQGTSRLDVVATFMARTFPGIGNSLDNAEWDKVMREVKRVAPGLMEEMWMPADQMREMMWREGVFEPGLAAFRANGPILGAYMQAFAAKVGFALHFEDVGSPIPESGGVQVRWFTSGELFRGDIPASLFESVGEVKIMKQGIITSDRVFEYGWGEYVDKPDIKVYYAKVREAFAVAAFVSEDRAKLPFPVDAVATFAPGELSLPLRDRITWEPM
jgi:hypothetical protein